MPANVTASREASPAPGHVALLRSVGPGQATALAISIVVGSGLLVLPGVAYQDVGPAAIYAWILGAMLVTPLLVIFVSLGRRFPGAGGIAGYVQAGFGRAAGAATEVLVIGTLGLGLPTVALAGGYYLAAAVGGDELLQISGALALLALAGAVNGRGVRLSGRVQQFLALALIVILAGGAAGALVVADFAGAGIAAPSDWHAALPVLAAVFFAYTGWEMLSFTTEEYRRPRRDFPIAVAASFMVVTLLYFALALAIQLSLSPADPRTATAPVAALLASVVGPVSAKLVAAIGVLIVAANLIGAVWAASRLVFASAREQLLPRLLAEVEPRSRVPLPAVTVTVATLAAVAVLSLVGAIPIATLFALAGQGFFILYTLAALSYVRLAGTPLARCFGLATLGLAVIAAVAFGPGLIYPVVLFGIGLLAHRLRSTAGNRAAPVGNGWEQQAPSIPMATAAVALPQGGEDAVRAQWDGAMASSALYPGIGADIAANGRPLRTRHSEPKPILATILMREATPADEPELARLAGRDSTTVPTGPLLLAFVDDELRVAYSTRQRLAIADPWHRTAELRALLRFWAVQLEYPESSAAYRSRTGR